MQVLQLLLIALAGGSCAAQSLNLSQDLVSRGIASSNMTPNQPALDSRPLLEAAITYAQSKGIPLLTADTGAYYFLSLHNNMTHVLINSVSNLTLDLHNSDLYFKTPGASTILCTSCTAVTLQNFTVDYLNLPFTQVTVTSVNSSNRSINFAPIPGYPAPASFNNGIVPSGDDSYVGFFFHNGVPIPQTGRMSVQTPISGSTIAFTGQTAWSTPAAIGAVQPGDIFVYTDRGGPHTIHFESATDCTVHNVSIYSGGAMGLTFPGAVNMTVDHVQIIPRPGTDRLISTNADGIHGTFAGPGNVITNSIVRRTCDDSLAYDDPWAATVSAKPNGSAVAVQRYATLPIPVGASLSFVDPNTEAIVGTAKVLSEKPAVSNQTLQANEAITLTLDQMPSGVASGFGVINNDPTQHGNGSTLQNNLVQEGVFSRGIWLSSAEYFRPR
jgi:hypothetical protein